MTMRMRARRSSCVVGVAWGLGGYGLGSWGVGQNALTGTGSDETGQSHRNRIGVGLRFLTLSTEVAAPPAGVERDAVALYFFLA